MRVFRLGSDSDKYEALTTADEDTPAFRFDGTPKGDSWRPVRVWPEHDPNRKRQRPPGDFPSLLRPPVFSRRAVDCIGDVLRANGELLPLDCESGEYYVYNVTNLTDALDEDRSQINRGEDGRVWSVWNPHFRPEALEGELIFKLVQHPTGDVYVTDEFVELVRMHRLKGFKFREVWNSDTADSTSAAESTQAGPQPAWATTLPAEPEPYTLPDAPALTSFRFPVTLAPEVPYGIHCPGAQAISVYAGGAPLVTGAGEWAFVTTLPGVSDYTVRVVTGRKPGPYTVTFHAPGAVRETAVAYDHPGPVTYVSTRAGHLWLKADRLPIARSFELTVQGATGIEWYLGSDKPVEGLEITGADPIISRFPPHGHYLYLARVLAPPGTPLRFSSRVDPPTASPSPPWPKSPPEVPEPDPAPDWTPDLALDPDEAARRAFLRLRAGEQAQLIRLIRRAAEQGDGALLDYHERLGLAVDESGPGMPGAGPSDPCEPFLASLTALDLPASLAHPLLGAAVAVRGALEAGGLSVESMAEALDVLALPCHLPWLRRHQGVMAQAFIDLVAAGDRSALKRNVQWDSIRSIPGLKALKAVDALVYGAFLRVAERAVLGRIAEICRSEEYTGWGHDLHERVKAEFVAPLMEMGDFAQGLVGEIGEGVGNWSGSYCLIDECERRMDVSPEYDHGQRASEVVLVSALEVLVPLMRKQRLPLYVRGQRWHPNEMRFWFEDREYVQERLRNLGVGWVQFINGVAQVIGSYHLGAKAPVKWTSDEPRPTISWAGTTRGLALYLLGLTTILGDELQSPGEGRSE